LPDLLDELLDQPSGLLGPLAHLNQQLPAQEGAEMLHGSMRIFYVRQGGGIIQFVPSWDGAVFRIQIHCFRIRIHPFRIQIQSLYDKNWKKCTAEKKICHFFKQKLQFTYP
jgi:hypothetical protein